MTQQTSISVKELETRLNAKGCLKDVLFEHEQWPDVEVEHLVIPGSTLLTY
ncbi:MAG: hypothetical protein QGD92_09150 [Gammaproteobacteria bacterium]|nr:hypothetical protein [Gammaproteobacteria bacterium]